MIVSILTIIPSLFPAMYGASMVRSDTFAKGLVSQFELGIFFYPIIITNVLIFSVFLFLKYKSKKIPKCDISRRTSLIILIIILGIFSVFSFQDLTSIEQHEDWIQVKNRLLTWPPNHITAEPHIRYILLESSFYIFGNYRIIPFLSSIILLVVVNAFTNKITNNRIAGLVASGVVLQSNLFLSFSTTPTYTVFWSLFYLISLYVIHSRIWIASPVLHILSILSKPLSVTFSPMSIFFILNSQISKNKKIILVIITMMVLLIGFAFTGTGPLFNEFNLKEFWIGFTSFSYQMRFDGFIVIMLIPTIVGLYLISKKNPIANNISIIISGILLTNPIMLAMTNYTSQPYRFIPLIIFCAIGIGMLFVNYNNINSNMKKSKRFSKKSK